MWRRNIVRGKNDLSLIACQITPMTRYTLLFLLTLFHAFYGYGQDTLSTGFGNVLPEEFHPSSPVIDSNADVVVLSDIGRAELIGVPLVGWRLEFTRCRKLLIRNQKGLNASKI